VEVSIETSRQIFVNTLTQKIFCKKLSNPVEMSPGYQFKMKEKM